MTTRLTTSAAASVYQTAGGIFGDGVEEDIRVRELLAPKGVTAQ